MNATATAQAPAKIRWGGARRAALALLALVLLLAGGAGVLAPWYDVGARAPGLPAGAAGCAGEAATYAGQPAGCRRAEAGLALTVHTTPAAYPSAERWRAAQWGTYVVFVLIGGLIALAWRPREHTLVLQHMLVTAAAGAVLAALLSPALLPIVLAPALIALPLCPAPRGLLARSAARPSVPLLALGALAAALLAADAWAGYPQAAEARWAGGLLLDAALALAALLAATRRPGWAALGLMTGAALIYLGLAAVLLADQAGAWRGGIPATIGGWLFVGATYWELRRARSSARPMRAGGAGV